MEDSGWDKEVSPYHPGEAELHERLGRKDHQERMGRRIHRPFMPQQHRTFFAQLPFVVAGSIDGQGWPWASMLFGTPGFMGTPDDKTLSIAASTLPGDPFGDNAEAGAPVSFVGIELPTRRRNRVNGVVRSHEGADVQVDVVQSFGNCPQYIHTRDMDFVRDPATPEDIDVETFTSLDGTARDILARADTFFVASYNDREDKFTNGGVDVNHRGGRPGFVRIDGDTLTIPDFIGNFAFNTLGNFMVVPKAGLIFVDFATGDLVQLTGTVELLWDKTEETEAFRGAERSWRFTLHHGQRLIGASPLRFKGGEASPNTRLTGTWDEAEEAREAQAQRLEWRPFRVTRIEDESAVIRSFYLEPADGKALPAHKPGQYLTIRATPEGAEKSVVRTYTLSSAPADPHYRISVKREDAGQDKPAGVVSSHLHASVKVGDLIETRAPNGAFWMDTDEERPAVLIAGGVGITPMVAMARQAMTEGFSRRHLRPLTIFHAARTKAERAFASEFGAFQDASDGGLRYISLIGRPGPQEKAGRDFHRSGRISPEILQAYLPLADYDFFLCGPAPFMQRVYDILMTMGVRDKRIFAEAFGPAALKRVPEEGGATDEVEEADEAIVSFEASGFEQAWTPENGTLLELAEAHGLTPNYGCRSGACGTCAVRLTGGKVAYRHRPDFPPEPEDVLICCAAPAPSSEPLRLDL
ncbi:pyridoxamine 5'-phosphate oxidase family protein [Tritonibacter scottomollicae]|uniref:2Fe-2S iron-sulfur cluster-binding protein n=1 Tax=Tritonibacter scottomollicae TaxID=483013 RepID=UPI003AA9599D